MWNLSHGISSNAAELKQMKRGDAPFRHKSDTTAVIWIDRKPVHVVSNVHPPTMTTVKRKNRDGSISTVSCPYIVDQYNRHMGGVDFTDQLKVYYGYNRKSKHWWLRLFFHFFRYCCCQCICSVSALLSTQLASYNEIQAEKTAGHFGVNSSTALSTITLAANSKVQLFRLHQLGTRHKITRCSLGTL